MGSPFQASLPVSKPKRTRSLYLCIVALVLIFFYQNRSGPVPSAPPTGITNHDSHGFHLADQHSVPAYEPVTARVAKVSMLYGKPSAMYQKAIATHKRHAALHNYPLHLLVNEVSTDFWNKPTYLLSVLLRELEKDPGDRVEWLLWFDADSILLNPLLPLEVFLPPINQAKFKTEHIHLLMTKDFNGLNTGIFFMRVHPWSADFLTRTLAYSRFRPDEDLGYNADQMAMALLLNETDTRRHNIFIPKTWINSYLNEVQPGRGDLLVHFPGMGDRERAMRFFLDRIQSSSSSSSSNQERETWSIPLEESSIVEETARFWRQVRDCTELIRDIEVKMHDVADSYDAVPLRVRDAWQALKEVLWYEIDVESAVGNATKKAVAALQALIDMDDD